MNTPGFSTWRCSRHSRNHCNISSISILFQPALRIHVFPPRLVPPRPPASAQGGSDGHEARPGRHRAKEVRGGETTLRSGQQGANMGMGCWMLDVGWLVISQLLNFGRKEHAFGRVRFWVQHWIGLVFHYPNQCGDVQVLSCRDITVN